MATKIPGVYVQIRGDYTQLEKDAKAARQMVSAQAKGMSDALGNALSPASVNTGVKNLVSSLGTLERNSVGVGTTFKNISVDLGEFTKNTGLSEKEFSKLQQRMLETRASNAQELSLKKVARSTNLNTAEVKKLGKQYGLSNSQIKKVNSSLDRSQTRFKAHTAVVSRSTKAVTGFVGAYAGIHTIAAVGRVADDYTMASAKIQLATSSQQEYNDTYQSLYQISKDTGGQLITNAQVVNRLALNSDFAIGDIVKSQEILSKSMVVAGTTTAEATGFMQQYGQAMGSSTVNGDEFRTMSEANSYVLGLIADKLNTNIKGLKDMGAEGTLTSELFFKTLLSVEEDVNRRFVQMPVTVARSLNNLSEVVKSIVADTDSSTDSSSELAAAITEVADTVDENRETIVDLFSAIVVGASKGVDVVGQLTRSVQGLAIVAASEDKSLFDWVFSNDEDMKRWQQEVDDGTAFLKDQLAVVRQKISDTQDAWGGFLGKKDKLAELREQESEILSSIDRIKTASIDSSLTDFFGDIDKGKPITYDNTKDSWLKRSAEDAAAAKRGLKMLDKAEEAAYQQSVRRLKEKQVVQETFNDAYLKSTLSQTDYALVSLQKEYDAYAKHVTDKTKLEQWFVTEKNAILETQRTAKNDAHWEEWYDNFDSLAEKSDETSDYMQDAFTGWANSMSSSFTDMIFDADFAFDSILESFGRMVTQMIVQKRLIEPLSGAIGGFDFGSLFSFGGSSGGASAYTAGGGMAGFPGLHSGGIVGAESTFIRSLPKMHSGGIVGSDEQLTILQNGEGVFTEGQMRALGGGGTKININITNNTDSSVSAESRENSDGSVDLELMIDQTVGKLANTPGSHTNRAVMGATGASTQLTRR